MDYKAAYTQLINTIMDDIDDIPVQSVEKVKAIHDQVSDGAEVESGSSLTVKEWNGMTYKDRVELKNNDPAAYDAAVQGQLKE